MRVMRVEQKLINCVEAEQGWPGQGIGGREEGVGYTVGPFAGIGKRLHSIKYFDGRLWGALALRRGYLIE